MFNLKNPQHQTTYRKDGARHSKSFRAIYPHENNEWKNINDIINSRSPLLTEGIEKLGLKGYVGGKLIMNNIYTVKELVDALDDGRLKTFEPDVIENISERLKQTGVIFPERNPEPDISYEG